MSKLLEKFDELLGHLNAEENDLAGEFRKSLQGLIEEAADDGRWRECVEGAGVDNWCGYEFAMEEYHGEEDEDYE